MWYNKENTAQRLFVQSRQTLFVRYCPKISQTHKGGVEMRKKGIAVFCGLAVLFSILFGGFPQKWQVSAAADMTNFAEEAAALTNQFRQENGLPALQLAPVLLDLSAQRAEELSQTYGHNRPDGREWFSVIEDSTLDSNCYAAENVAAGYDTPQEVVQAWIDSPTHRKAMLGGTVSVYRHRGVLPAGRYQSLLYVLGYAPDFLTGTAGGGKVP